MINISCAINSITRDVVLRGCVQELFARSLSFYASRCLVVTGFISRRMRRYSSLLTEIRYS